jgi:hypothetical protein
MATIDPHVARVIRRQWKTFPETRITQIDAEKTGSGYPALRHRWRPKTSRCPFFPRSFA